jgi:hypothetical protein
VEKSLMEFVLGTVSMVAAIAMLGAAKYVITQWEESSWVRNFAGTETMALAITMLAAFGIAFLFAGLASNQSNIGYTEFAAAIGVIVLAALGVSRVFRRRTATGTAATPAVKRAAV